MQHTAEGPRTRRAVGLALLGVVVLAVALRVPLLFRAIASDEEGNAWQGPVWGLLTDAEVGVNAPLWRIVLHAFLEPVPAIWFGRGLSLVAGLACVPVAFLLARRAAGHGGAGLLAALLVAVNPVAVRVSAEARVYAWLGLAAMLWVWTLVDALEAPEPTPSGRRWRLLAVAVLLPWLHYLAVPLLGVALLGLAWKGRRDLALLHGAALLTVAPLGWMVLHHTSRRVAPPQGTGHSLAYVLSLGTGFPAPFDALAKGMGVTGPLFPEAAAGLFGALLIVALAGGAGGSTVRAWLGVGAVTSVVTMAAVGQVQHVRPPAAMLLVAFAVPLLAALPWRAPVRGLRWAGVVAVGWLLLAGAPRHLASWRDRDDHAGLDGFAARWHAWDDARADGPVWVSPPSALGGLSLRLTGDTLRMRRDEACGGASPCFAVDGVPFRRPSGDASGLHVDFSPSPPPLAEGCHAVHEAHALRVATCAE